MSGRCQSCSFTSQRRPPGSRGQRRERPASVDAAKAAGNAAITDGTPDGPRGAVRHYTDALILQYELIERQDEQQAEATPAPRVADDALTVVRPPAAVFPPPSPRVRALHASLTIVDMHADSLMWTHRDLNVRAAAGHVDAVAREAEVDERRVTAGRDHDVLKLQVEV